MTPNVQYVGVIPKPLRELENVTGAYIHEVVSSKWVKYQFRVKYPFKVYTV